MWELHYKIDREAAEKHGVEVSSDVLGYGPFDSREGAEIVARNIRKDPGGNGFHDVMSDAVIWAEQVERE